jgi:hypothetical protein
MSDHVEPLPFDFSDQPRNMPASGIVKGGKMRATRYEPDET